MVNDQLTYPSFFEGAKLLIFQHVANIFLSIFLVTLWQNAKRTTRVNVVPYLILFLNFIVAYCVV